LYPGAPPNAVIFAAAAIGRKVEQPSRTDARASAKPNIATITPLFLSITSIDYRPSKGLNINVEVRWTMKTMFEN